MRIIISLSVFFFHFYFVELNVSELYYGKLMLNHGELGMKDQEEGWIFKEDGTFQLNSADRTSYLYFPLINELGMMSSITPTLHGDAKLDQNTFLLRPTSVEDLHSSRDGRNFWVKFQNGTVWSVTGNSVSHKKDIYLKFKGEHFHVKGGFLWHELTHENSTINLRATITNFVPVDNSTAELMEIKLTNTGNETFKFTPTAAIPIYGRSADNLRDHRHVTSLLHRIRTTKYGVLVQPTMDFDERGHHINNTSYAVLGSDDFENPPETFFPIVEDFIGSGGSFDWPEQIINPSSKSVDVDQTIHGFEALGGLQFKTIELHPSQTVSYRLVLSIYQGLGDCTDILYLQKSRWNKAFSDMQAYWKQKLSNLSVLTGDSIFNQWMKWVTLQPILRRIMGCSFLPYHDYGRGGRGWRDLWQDCLSLLFLEPIEARKTLVKSFSGVRIDGSNATIIGKKLGHFKADRNKIPRVWMDHGAWPFLTLKMYIDQTGDYNILFTEQPYFKDQYINRCNDIDKSWEENQETILRTKDGKVFQGTILEHILVENLTAFFNVGAHNIIRLEDADWNDGLDMAFQKGESVAFSALFAQNLTNLSNILSELYNTYKISETKIAQELLLFLDSFQQPLNYDSTQSKQNILQNYFNLCSAQISGEKITVSLPDLIKDITRKADWLANHIRTNEYIRNKEGYCWFNGYYDNDGKRLEGDHPFGVRMTLTGQTFTTLSYIATESQLNDMIKSVENYLWDDSLQGVRLNTNFHEIILNMGRAFAFAYGSKENGSMFSHMAVMFAYALYERRRSKYGFKILNGIFKQATNFSASHMYPGIPEYFNQRGRGMYPYLTGSASWYMLTLITKVFGIRGYFGDLILDPQLQKSQFDSKGLAKIITLFNNQRYEVSYQNVDNLEPEDFAILSVRLNDHLLPFNRVKFGIRISKKDLTHFSHEKLNVLIIHLGNHHNFSEG